MIILNTSKRLFVYLVCFISIFINVINVYSQNNILKKNISISVTKMQLDEVLNYIEEKGGVAFSYNSKLIPKDKLITLESDNLMIDDLLKILLNELKLNYRVLNDIITIYAPLKTQEKKLKINHVQYSVKNFNIYDTVIKVIYDTIKIIKHDTIYHNDILHTEKVKPKKKVYPGKFSIGLYGSPIFNISNNHILRKKEFDTIELTNNLPDLHVGYSIGTNLDLIDNNWIISTGLVYSKFKDIFSYDVHSSNIHETSFYKDTTRIIFVIDTDTINADCYAEYPNGEIIWISNTIQHQAPDSVLIIKYDTGNISKNYITTNKISSLEVPLYIGRIFTLNKKYKIKVSSGIISSIYLDNIFNIKMKENPLSANSLENNNFNKISMMASFSFGLSCRAFDRISIYSDIVYKKYIKPVYSNNYFISSKPSYLHLTLGIQYHF